MIISMRAWIELPSECGWGPVQMMKAALIRSGYRVEEYRGTGPGMLLLTGTQLPGYERRPPRSSMSATTYATPGASAREPKRARTAPAGTLDADSMILLDENAEIELQDGSRVYARVGAQCRDLDRRWHLYLCWYASSPLTGREHWFLYLKSGRLQVTNPPRRGGRT
jgi:hypothetical protein